MKRFMSTFGIVALILIAVAPVRAEDSVRIGVISSRSGPFAALGQQGDEATSWLPTKSTKPAGYLAARSS
jgi:hypothetical protein